MAKIVAKPDTTLLWLGNFGQQRNSPNGTLAKALHVGKADLDFPSQIGNRPNTRLRGSKYVENMCKTEEIGLGTTKEETFLLQKIRWETDFLAAIFDVGITRTSVSTTRYGGLTFAAIKMPKSIRYFDLRHYSCFLKVCLAVGRLIENTAAGDDVKSN